ncbi:MAG TPA: hypothetical protein VFK57_20090 [Vicinamibacterales bacterium]|nr:hypothetical protein [Vicinamibacterales bacterium]
MPPSALRRTIPLAAALCCGLWIGACAWRGAPAPSLTDAEFRSLIQTLSEPPGTFDISDNLVSNEPHVAENARRVWRRGGVYVGVGPEQNFTYIASVRPVIAYVVDIRRENRSLHFFYKALFELSSDRADFVARLFSRPRPAGLGAGSSAREIFDRFDAVPPSAEQLQWNAATVRRWLLETRRLPLDSTELAWIDRLFTVFHDSGPSIQFWQARDTEPAPSFRRLMTMPDASGFTRSFLATEEDFRFVKDLHLRNLIVPVVGNFAGPTALRRIGDDIRSRGHRLSVFYGSNVGVYLTREQTRAFCRNLAALPAADDAAFIERDGVQKLSAKLRTCGG